MSLNLRSTAFLLAIAPVAALAQPASAHPDPADPAASSLPTAYVSVFTGFRASAADAAPSPDKSWIGHNRQLMPAPKAAAPQNAPASAPNPVPIPAPHQHGGRGMGS